MVPDLFLLAEDDENDAILFEHVFKKLNKAHRLEVVTDGEQVIHYLLGEGRFSDRDLFPFPSMVILDTKLPKKSGREVLDWIKLNPIDRPLFVATLSGDSQRSAPAKTIERFGRTAVFNCHYLKPATLNNLETLLGFFDTWRLRNR